jgi:hypothetical protein
VHSRRSFVRRGQRTEQTRAALKVQFSKHCPSHAINAQPATANGLDSQQLENSSKRRQDVRSNASNPAARLGIHSRFHLPFTCEAWLPLHHTSSQPRKRSSGIQCLETVAWLCSLFQRTCLVPLALAYIHLEHGCVAHGCTGSLSPKSMVEFRSLFGVAASARKLRTR